MHDHYRLRQKTSRAEPDSVSQKSDTIRQEVYETIENNGSLVLTDWKIPKPLRAKLDQKLDMLRTAEVDEAGLVTLPPNAIRGPKMWGQKWIYKVIVNGEMALRPMICRGPVDRDTEWTVLTRATERDRDTTEQKAAAADATIRRQEILDGKRVRSIYPRIEK